MGISNKIAVALLAFFVALVALVLALRVKNRKNHSTGPSESLARWARDAHFSTQQLAAMRSLWQWYKTGKRPKGGSVGLLSAAEIADLEQKCDIGFMPAKYRVRDEQQIREALVLELRALGMDEIEADILAGMIQAGFGPAANLAHYQPV